VALHDEIGERTLLGQQRDLPGDADRQVEGLGERLRDDPEADSERGEKPRILGDDMAAISLARSSGSGASERFAKATR
jgi:hypothetical protein